MKRVSRARRASPAKHKTKMFKGSYFMQAKNKKIAKGRASDINDRSGSVGVAVTTPRPTTTKTFLKHRFP